MIVIIVLLDIRMGGNKKHKTIYHLKILNIIGWITELSRPGFSIKT